MRRWIFWEFPRASWQYDIVVALILAFIFLTPRELFRDQPLPASIVMVPASDGQSVFFIDPHILRQTPESERPAIAARMIQQRYKQQYEIVRLETEFDAENEIRGFLAYAKR